MEEGGGNPALLVVSIIVLCITWLLWPGLGRKEQWAWWKWHWNV